MNAHYKLYYFNFPGKAEIIRMLFAYGGIPFEDFRFERKDWPAFKTKMPIGQVPVLEINGKPYWQSTPLCRYVANIVELDGKDRIENLAIDCIVDSLWDLLTLARNRFKETDEERRKQIERSFNEQAPLVLNRLEENIRKNNGFVAINRFTWADIALLYAYEALLNLITERNVFENYPSLIKLKDRVLENKNLREYILKRPKSMEQTIYDLKYDF